MQSTTPMTPLRRLAALVRASGYFALHIFVFFNQPNHTSVDVPDSDTQKMKANFAYFLGNPHPLEAIQKQEKPGR